MAFVPQPSLPSTKKPQSRVRVSTRAVADGVISVSRRRRVYEFLSAASKALPPLAPESTAVHVSAPPSSNGVSEQSPDANQVREELVSRMKQREDAIKADAARKQALWQAELDALRSLDLQPPQPVTKPAASQEAPPAPSQSYFPSRSSQTAALFGADDVIAEKKPSTAAVAAAAAATTPTSSTTEPVSSVATRTAPTDDAPAVEESAPSTTRAASTTTPAPASTVSELYRPPSPTEGSEDSRPWRFQDLVEDVREAVEDVVEDVIEAFTPDEKEKAPAKAKEVPEPAAKSTLETKEVSEEDEEDRSIGEVILDAIVEGVDTPEAEKEKAAVDKSDLIKLIDSGKIKNLTVTKLRRLLTQNGLKTSGRKAELIARLTSYAKAK